MPKAKSKPSSNGRVEVPNALSKQDRVQAVANALMAMQQQDLELTLLQQANGADDDDMVPGLPPELPDGNPATYRNRRAAFRDGQMRVATQNRDLMPQVQGFIHGQHSQQPG